jgi:hypothetical protein
MAVPLSLPRWFGSLRIVILGLALGLMVVVTLQLRSQALDANGAVLLPPSLPPATEVLPSDVPPSNVTPSDFTSPDEIEPFLWDTRDVVQLSASAATGLVSSDLPKTAIAWADPTNYGDRVTQDIDGVAVFNRPIVVLHESVGSALSAVNTFRTPHPIEWQQSSYHALIELDGTIVQTVPFASRAFGAANSVFVSGNGPEAVKTHAEFPPSVNNFAYHIAFETPLGGRNNALRHHEGYTAAQYNSLGWLVTQLDVPEDRIATHQQVDRTGSRFDPRSYMPQQLAERLVFYRQLRAAAQP